MTAALEHLTGPSRGTVTWLSGSAFDVFLEPNGFLRICEAGTAGPGDALVARLHRAEDSYELEALEDRPLWVNGKRIGAHKLKGGSMIEFGETGPLSRFCLHRDNERARGTLAEIVSDTVAYLRVSRQPYPNRAARAASAVTRRLTRETTILFRVGVVVAIAALAVLVYQQYRLNLTIQQRLDSDTALLESFASALTRAGQEALTQSDLEALRQEIGPRVLSNEERLVALERRSGASARVIAEAASSVVFLQGAYGYREPSSERMLRHVVDSQGRSLITPRGQPLLSLDGGGPVAELQFSGSGFVIADGDVIVTNRHVAMPWVTDANIALYSGQGLEAIMTKFLAYFPGEPRSRPVELVRASDEADIALLRSPEGIGAIAGLQLADALPASGKEVIVMGYPTGVRSMLAQAGNAFIEELQSTGNTGFWTIAARLAEAGHIAPLATRGIVGQLTASTIVYDAETTHGGSGGPVLDTSGAVVAVNAAILPEFGGSNFGVPVAMVRALLERGE